MPASRSLSVLLAVAALVAAGCAAPGAQRLQGAPDGMPPSLRYVTADVLGFTLYATDADAWAGATGVAADPVLEQAYESVGLTAEEAEPWVGDHVGIAVRQLDVPGADDDTTAFFADVRSGAKVALEAAGWAAEDEGPEDLPSVNGESAELLTRGDGEFRAAAVFDDGLLVARTTDGLRGFLEAADEYAVPERRAMSQYAADVARRVPAGAVFRFDFLRTQLRRPFQEDPALLEFARWATESDALIATRDGWVGLAPGDDADRARLIGAVEWVPDLAAEIEWEPVAANLLDELGGDIDVSVAFDDPGAHLSLLLRGITFRNGQYATEQDVEEGDRVELEPVLEQLDGPAVVAVSPDLVSLRVQGAAAAEDDVEEAAELAGVDLLVDRVSEDLTVKLRRGGALVGTDELSTRARQARDAGEPPRPPIAWVWVRSLAGCTGPAAGWVTFDGEGEMTFAVGIDVAGTSVRPPTVGSGSVAAEFCDLRALVPFT